MIKKLKNMKNKSKKFMNCWEFMECPNYLKENCEAYKRNLGRECWMVAKDTGKGCYGYKKYNGCRKCPWFKKIVDFHF